MFKEWLFPWESHIMLSHPLEMPIFMVIASILLSIVTWTRGHRHGTQAKQKDQKET